MTKFETLSTKFRKLKSTDVARRTALRDKVGEIYRAFPRYLGLHVDYSGRDDGQTSKHVLLGQKEGPNFEHVGLDGIRDSGDSISFALQVILDSEAYGTPQNAVWVDMRLVFDGADIIAEDPAAGQQFRFGSEGLTPLFDHMYAVIAQQIK